jgi:DNA processing protein
MLNENTESGLQSIFEIKKESFSESFLSTLLEIPDCPKNIFMKGKNIDRKNTKFLAVVGSRNHSSYAKMALEKIMSEISGYNIVIISGLAIGIDSLAHEFALKNNLKTIAIPGSGISEKVLYPRSNVNLSKKILDGGGNILSEFEPDSKSMPYFFPQRNRIMAGLADVVLVVEAAEKSGTLITARLTVDYNKDLCVIPSSIFSDFSAGSNRLLKQGAHPIFSGKEILELLGLDPENEKSVSQKKLNFDDFTETEIKILKSLTEPKNKEEIQEETKLNISELNTTLSILEIKDVVIEKLGKFRKK